MTNIETRLRRQLPALADAIIASEAPTMRVDDRATDGPVGAARRLLAVASAALIAIVGALAAVTVVRRNEPMAMPASPPATTASNDQPIWFTTIAAHVPDGFTRLGVSESGDAYVDFEAFNPSTSHSLYISISRSPIDPDPDSDPDAAVSLDDGRQLQVSCGIAAIPQTPTIPQVDRDDCPRINGTAVDSDQLRTLLESLAADLPAEDLPAPSDDPDSANSGFSITSYGTLRNERPQLFIRAVAGLRSTTSKPDVPGEIELSDRRISWATMDDGTVWTIATDLSLDPTTGSRVLDAARSLGPTPLDCLFDGPEEFGLKPLTVESIIARLEQLEVGRPERECPPPMTAEEIAVVVDYLRTL
jgi:hypothetical protein